MSATVWALTLVVQQICIGGGALPKNVFIKPFTSVGQERTLAVGIRVSQYVNESVYLSPRSDTSLFVQVANSEASLHSTRRR